jgi:UDP-N-acetylmuramoyl-L-alanyl-D-glutamate--2,6-diaminopimelate ligase
MRIWQQFKNVFHWARAQWWRAYYCYPDKWLTLHGVTGTNGKTTTCYILAGILAEELGEERVGMLTTVAFRVGRDEEVNESKMTTLKSAVVMKYLRRMVDAGVEQAVVEVTSHALDQNRLAGLRFKTAVITNIAREHLDYHRTMAEYAEAKAKIGRKLESDGALIGKGDDPLVSLMLKQAKRRGVLVKEWTAAEAREIATPLLGEVNKENAMAAKLAAEAIGVMVKNIQAGIEKVTTVPGRMEWMRKSGRPAVLIDYAVTPDALERLYTDVKKETNGKIYAVLGACGLRDRGKRPLMAKVVAELADELILTREDPWTEDEEQIFNDLEKGLVDAKISWRRIIDRREAIKYCLERADEQDVIVVTGKGAETGMAIKHEVVPWSDKQVIAELLEN